MSLISIVNIGNGRKDRKSIKVLEKKTTETDYGFSVYETLEYSKSKQKHNSFGLHTEIIKSALR